MTIFALDTFVRTATIGSDIVFVALGAGLLALVLDGEVLPLLNIAKPIVVVGKAIAMNTEILRNEELPGE
jgi:hypothetical protein